MKKRLSIFALLIWVSSNAQIREGMVKYSMKLDSKDEMANQLLSNTSVTVYFKNEKSLVVMTTLAYSMKSLTDASGVLTLMDGAGQKTYFKKTKEEIAKDKAGKKIPDPKITFTKEKKKILGYDCTKVIINQPDISGKIPKGGEIVIWHTDKILSHAATGPLSSEAAAVLKGMALEIDMQQGEIKSRMTASEISTKPVGEAIFNLSTAGFTEKKSGSGNTIRK
jgi:GLPGLI family protein